MGVAFSAHTRQELDGELKVQVLKENDTTGEILVTRHKRGGRASNIKSNAQLVAYNATHLYLYL